MMQRHAIISMGFHSNSLYCISICQIQFNKGINTSSHNLNNYTPNRILKQKKEINFYIYIHITFSYDFDYLPNNQSNIYIIGELRK
jgi:hypothetical protein